MFEEVEKKIHEVKRMSSEQMHDKSIAQILSSLSHELRTPLSILSSNLQLLKKNENLDTEIRVETFQLFEEALGSVTRFLDQIYFLNLSNKGELKSQSTIFNVDDFLNRVLNQPQTLLYQSDRIKLATNFLNKEFCSDEVLLKHILTNLLDNALKFSSKEVSFRISSDDQYLNILIEDQGMGMPEDQIDYLFEPFTRGSNVKMISGSGLGLAIVKRSVDCLDGIIYVDSDVSKGTTIKLKIPADEC
ncbi:MAG TPA: HAMP domain-containing sensor histidine kinase [Sunxiuqinia sp.]|nr:HAMP domain-containing sensor histidine kinase [Sunxiuqinia sp.]